MSDPEDGPVEERLRRLRDDFDKMLQSSSGELRHAMWLVNNEEVSVSECAERMKTVAVVMNPRQPLAILSDDRVTPFDSLRRGMWHGFLGSGIGTSDLKRYQDLAKQAFRGCTEVLELRKVDYRLVTQERLALDAWRTPDLYWTLACYNLAWDCPKRLNYEVQGLGLPDDLTRCRLQLLTGVEDVGGLPDGGKDLVIVALKGDRLHFRIFDGLGQMIVDTDEEQHGEEQDHITSIKDFLRKDPDVPPERVPHVRGLVIDAVKRVVGYARPGRPCCPFTDRQRFEEWGKGASDEPEPAQPVLPRGRHWLWLSGDLRLCSREAIDLVLQLGRKKPSELRLKAYPDGDNSRFILDDDVIYCKSIVAVAYIAELLKQPDGQGISFDRFAKINWPGEKYISSRELDKIPSKVSKFIERGSGKRTRVRVDMLRQE